MAWKRERLIGSLACLALVSLPWQTVFFFETVRLHGWVWDQGKQAVYASWLIVLALGLGVGLSWWKDHAGASMSRYRLGLGILWACFFTETLVSSVFLPATLQWWRQSLAVCALVFFIRCLKLEQARVMRWYVFGLVPSVVIGAQQWLTQRVAGGVWIGMAPQDPLTPGVSVVELLGQRVLRVYGQFPHPNIFGAWLALAVPCLILLFVTVRSVRNRLAWLFLMAACASMLVLTFSRTAWLAAGAGAVSAAWTVWTDSTGDRLRKKHLAAILACLSLSFAATAWFFRPLILTRIQAQVRLEQLSITTRRQAWNDGWRLFRLHPWFGVGPGNAVYALDRTGIVNGSQPIEPPHLLPLLMLDELGIVGVGLLALLAGLTFHHRRLIIWPLLTLVPLALTDHFLWSLWPGQTLFACALLFSLHANGHGHSQ